MESHTLSLQTKGALFSSEKVFLSKWSELISASHEVKRSSFSIKCNNQLNLRHFTLNTKLWNSTIISLLHLSRIWSVGNISVSMVIIALTTTSKKMISSPTKTQLKANFNCLQYTLQVLRKPNNSILINSPMMSKGMKAKASWRKEVPLDLSTKKSDSAGAEEREPPERASLVDCSKKSWMSSVLMLALHAFFPFLDVFAFFPIPFSLFWVSTALLSLWVEEWLGRYFVYKP